MKHTLLPGGKMPTPAGMHHFLISRAVKAMTEESLMTVGSLTFTELITPIADRRSHYWALMCIIMCVYDTEQACREGGTWPGLFDWADTYDKCGGRVKLHLENKAGTMGQLLIVQDTAPEPHDFTLIAEFSD